MKIKQIIYVMFIITGILIEKYGLQSGNPEMEKYFGFGATIFIIEYESNR